MRLHFQGISYRSADEILNQRPSVKEEIEGLLTDPGIDIASLSRPYYTDLMKERFANQGWQPAIFHQTEYQLAKIDFIKERVGVEIGFRHMSLIGADLLKFQVASPFALNKIDVAVYIVTTRNFQKQMKKEFHHNWSGAMSVEKVDRYLRHFTSGIHVPVYLIAVDLFSS